MASWRRGRVTEVTQRRDGLISALVDAGGEILPAVAYPSMVAEIDTGDEVVVNTTGIDLDLGTGGVAFVLWNLSNTGMPQPGDGHIVKLRYTPWQTEVLAVEAPESAHHDALAGVNSVEGMPVVACGLHSQIAGVAAGIKAANPAARVGYLMTDGAALPLAYSNLVGHLRDAQLVDVTCTAGHSFGGELEAINVFSGLAALRTASGADAAVVSMGPGVVGTGTALGFTALEQGQIIDAALALNGRAIACLRISFADRRPRHRGVSHHCLTALGLAAQRSCTVAVPELLDDQADVVGEQLEAAGVAERHELVTADGAPGVRLAVDRNVPLASMGRDLEDDPEFFLAAAAAGAVAGRATLTA